VNPDRWYDHYATPGRTKRTTFETDRDRAGKTKINRRHPDDNAGRTHESIMAMKPACGGAMTRIAENQWYGPTRNYDIEVSDPLGRKREPDSVNFNTDLYHWYKGLISIRRQHKALSRGDLNFFLLNDEEHVVAYSRTLGDEMIIIVVNNSNDKKIRRDHNIGRRGK